MKLLYVVHQFFPNFFTGTEQYCRALAEAGRAAGHEIEIFTLEPWFSLPDPGFKTWREDFEGLPVHRVTIGEAVMPNRELAEYDNPAVGEHFAGLLREVQPEVVHFFHLRYLGANLLEIARAAGCGVAVHLMDFWYMCPRITLLKADGSLCDGPESPTADCLRCAHGGLFDDFAAAGGPAAETWPEYRAGLLRHTDRLGDRLMAAAHRSRALSESWQHAHRIFAPSRFLAEVFRANGFPDASLQTISYGIDPKRLAGLAPQPSDQLRIGFMGTIAAHKGVHVLLEAFLGLDAAQASLAIHGRLTDFPEYAQDLQQKAAGDPRVQFCGPFEADELGATLSRIDVLVVPSLWYENTPFVVIEALAAGVPVLSSDLGGMTESFAGGKGGRGFPAGDAAALRRLLETYYQDRSELAALRPTPGQQKTLEDNWREFEAAYLELRQVAGQPGPDADPDARRRRDLFDMRSAHAQRRADQGS